jgi:hypothetical protein
MARRLPGDDSGVTSFDLVRHHRANERIFIYAFDLGDDLRRDPLKSAACVKIAAAASLHRFVVVLRFVHPRRDWPPAHGSSRIWPYQVARVGLIPEPAGVIDNGEAGRALRLGTRVANPRIRRPP